MVGIGISVAATGRGMREPGRSAEEIRHAVLRTDCIGSSGEGCTESPSLGRRESWMSVRILVLWMQLVTRVDGEAVTRVVSFVTETWTADCRRYSGGAVSCKHDTIWSFCSGMLGTNGIPRPVSN